MTSIHRSLRPLAIALAAAIAAWLLTAVLAHGAKAKPTCFGKPATVVGTPGKDHLKTGPGNDVVAGLGGNDFIGTGSGNDLVCGGSGDDLIVTGLGKDK